MKKYMPLALIAVLFIVLLSVGHLFTVYPMEGSAFVENVYLYNQIMDFDKDENMIEINYRSAYSACDALRGCDYTRRIAPILFIDSKYVSTGNIAQACIDPNGATRNYQTTSDISNLDTGSHNITLYFVGYQCWYPYSRCRNYYSVCEDVTPSFGPVVSAVEQNVNYNTWQYNNIYVARYRANFVVCKTLPSYGYRCDRIITQQCSVDSECKSPCQGMIGRCVSNSCSYEGKCITIPPEQMAIWDYIALSWGNFWSWVLSILKW